MAYYATKVVISVFRTQSKCFAKGFETGIETGTLGALSQYFTATLDALSVGQSKLIIRLREKISFVLLRYFINAKPNVHCTYPIYEALAVCRILMLPQHDNS